MTNTKHFSVFRLPLVKAAPWLSDDSHVNQPELSPCSSNFDSWLPAMYLQHYSLPSSAANVARLDPHSAQLMYQQSLQQAQTRISNAWEADTVARRDKTMQEFSLWLSQLPAVWGRTLMNCTPADVIAFLESHWLDTHAGTQMPDGSFISSPSGLNQCLSSLSTGFALLGRVASWTPEHPSGNPIL